MQKNTVNVNIRGKKTKALVDSGADISCISTIFLEKAFYANAKLDKSPILFVKGVGQKQLRVLGKLKIPISFNDANILTYVHVVESLPHSLILGHDFLTTNKVSLDFNTNTMCLNEDSSKMYPLVTSAGMVRADNPVVVPANHEMNISVKISRRKTGEIVLVEPIKSQFEVVSAKCIVQIQKGKSIIRVINPTDYDILVPQGKVLASVTDIYIASVSSLSSHAKTETCESRMTQNNSKDISFDLNNADLDKNQKQVISEFLKRHRNVFATDLSEIGSTNLYQHNIKTKVHAMPVRMPFYRQPPHIKKEIQKQVDEMLQNKIIEPSNSEWHSPVVMVKKKSGEYRFAIDYRKLNNHTIPMSFPLPRLESIFDTLGESKVQYFTTLDLASGF